jgi:hypothetical protein
MQIHELNSRKTVNEADLLGPNSVFNVGAQALKNPRAFTSSTALGSAQQAAAQSSAAASASKLAAQGYKAGGTAKNQITAQQQLPQTQANPAVQQLVKNLSAQWKSQGVAAAAKIKTAPVTEAPVTISNPSAVKDPAELKILDALYKQEAGQSTEPAAPDIQAKTNQRLNAFASEFQNWAEPKLQAIGVNYNSVMQDPWAARTIKSLLTDISIESLANPESAKTASLVEQFFNVAIATNQAQRQQSNRGPSVVGVAAPGAPANASADDQSVLKKYGVSLNQSQLEQLGQGMRRASGGSTVIKNTNNELLNAVARLAGFQIGQ